MKVTTTNRALCLLALLALGLSGSSCRKAEDNEPANPAVNVGGYAVTQVVNGGTITGRVTTSAQVAAPDLIIERDQEVCGIGHPNTSVPGSGSGVAGVVIYLDKIAAGKSMDAISLQGLVDQKHCQFLPHIQIVREKGKMIVSNSDDALHNFHLSLNGASILNEAQPAGVPPREVKLEKVGINTINCDVHPWMRGYVVVAKHPYYCITDTAGRFSLTDIPAGSYTVKLWRDNWQLEQPKDGSGHVASYKWGKDFEKEEQVIVTVSGTATVDFTLP